MADIRKFLKEKGYTDEQLSGMDKKMLDDLADLAAQMEEGVTARQRAEQIKQDLEVVKGQWNEYVVKSDGARAKALGELERTRTYLKEMKAAGYPIPDGYLDASTDPAAPVPPASPAPVKNDQPDLNQFFRANMELISMGGKYQRLTGNYLDPVTEFDDFEKNKRPQETLRSYIDRKYDLPAMEAKAEADKKAKYESDLVERGRKEAREEFAKSHGANPETRNPRSSNFDVIRADESRANSWNRARSSAITTDAVDRSRLEKYMGRTN